MEGKWLLGRVINDFPLEMAVIFSKFFAQAMFQSVLDPNPVLFFDQSEMTSASLRHSWLANDFLGSLFTTPPRSGAKSI